MDYNLCKNYLLLWATQVKALISLYRLSEYLSMYFEKNEEEFPYLDEIPEDACVKHMIYAWELALERSEQDGRRRRSMMT